MSSYQRLRPSGVFAGLTGMIVASTGRLSRSFTSSIMSRSASIVKQLVAGLLWQPWSCQSLVP